MTSPQHRLLANGHEVGTGKNLIVLVPTRSRPQNVMPIINAWFATGAFDVARLAFVVDADDMQYQNYLTELHNRIGVDVWVLPEWKPLVPKLNETAIIAANDYPFVAFMGDDHIPRTPRWAHTLVENHVTRFRLPRIWYGQDGLQDQRLPTWWSMDSRIITKLGRMVPAPVQHLFCDNAVKELGICAGRLSYDERILIEHMHPFAGKAPADDQYVRVNRHQQYERDGAAFRAWVADGLQRDATLVGSIGG